MSSVKSSTLAVSAPVVSMVAAWLPAKMNPVPAFRRRRPPVVMGVNDHSGAPASDDVVDVYVSPAVPSQSSMNGRVTWAEAVPLKAVSVRVEKKRA